MQVARLLVGTLLAATFTFAPPSPSAETSPSTSLDRAEAGSALDYSPATAATTSVADAPIPQKENVVDKKFIVAMASLGVAESLRITTHKLVLDHEYAAGAPWVTSVPANSHVVAKYSGFYAAELLLVYELKKSHAWLPGDRAVRKLWWMYPAAMTPMHIANGIRNIHTQPPSGCAAIECQ